MPDDVIAQHREAAAAAIEAGDSAAANEAYRLELAALAGADAAGPDDDADAGDEHEAAAAEHDDDAELPDEDLPAGPVPVEITSGIYERMRREFGDAAADRLQAAWGDHAVEYSALAGAVAADAHLAPIIERHMDSAGAITLAGAEAAYAALLAAGLPAEVGADSELHALVIENMDQATGAISPAGARIALAHVARKWGYKFSRRASPRASTRTSTTTTRDPAMSTTTAALKQGDELRDVRAKIREAQAEGDSRRANDLYRVEQRIIARQSGGNAPIVNGRRTA